MNNQDPQTAIDYNLYPSSGRPSGLQVPSLVVPTNDHLRRIVQLEEENAKLKAELAAFHAAMQRERKLDWAQELLDYVNEQARVADANSKEWANYGGASEQAAYRSGMWYAYNDIRNRIS